MSRRHAAAANNDTTPREASLLHVSVAPPATECAWQPTQPEPGAPLASDEEPTGDRLANDEAQAPLPESVLNAESDEVPAMDVGYGVDGASVPVGNAPGWKVGSDRNIMRRMLLLGRHTLKASEATDLIHTTQKMVDARTRVGLRHYDVERVIITGNQLRRFGRVDPSASQPGRCVTEARFTILLPGPDPDERLI